MTDLPSPLPPFIGSELSDGDFDRLREVLQTRRGFDLGRYKDRCIKRRIAARIRTVGLSAAAPYLELLQRDETEIDFLLGALTIHVSQFFRNPSTFKTLEREVLPRLVARARAIGQRQLRFWSVGCASGEEPYSLALLVENLAWAGIDIEILGSDISSPVLAQAADGRFEENRLQEVPAAMRDQFFVREGRFFELRAEVRRRVRFFRHDILAETSYPKAQLILCRNVLIYFSRAGQDQILRRFARTLGDGGYLVLGRAETLLGENRLLFHADFPAERIYRCTREGVQGPLSDPSMI